MRLEGDVARLRPGLTCDTEILVAERTDVITAPLQAVVQRPGERGGPDRTGVFVVRDGVASFMPVSTGIIGGLDIENRRRRRRLADRRRALPGAARAEGRGAGEGAGLAKP